MGTSSRPRGGLRIANPDGSDEGPEPGLRLVRGAHAQQPSAQQPSDDALARAFLGGDDRAFAELVRRHQRAVQGLARRFAPDAETARDIAQRTFLKALESARRPLSLLGRRPPIPFKPWLMRVALNLGKNAARDARRWGRAPVEAAEEAAAVAPVGASELERMERRRAVRAAVLDLPRRQREVLTLRIDGELSFADIADVLGITENAAKVTFHYAAKRLRDVVAGEDT